MRSQFDLLTEVKRLDEMKERKKLETQGLEIHQNMLALFSDKFDAFAGGLESSESASVGSSEGQSEELDAKKRFFDEIMRLKDKLDFSAYQSLVQVESELDKDFARTRSRIRLGTSATPRDRSYDPSSFPRARLTIDALKVREAQEDAEVASNPSSHDPAD